MPLPNVWRVAVGINIGCAAINFVISHGFGLWS